MQTINNPNKVTLEQARRVLEVVDAGLSNGLGEPTPGKMCVEAAVCYALGQPHGDEPSCVHPVVRRLKIALNDKNWSNNVERAKGMRELAIAQLGTADESFDVQVFVKTLASETIKQIVPIALRALLEFKFYAPHTVAFEAAISACAGGSYNAAKATKKLINEIKSADAAADAAAYAADAAAYAADAAAYAAAADAADYAAYAAAYADDAAAHAAADAATYAADAAAHAAADAAATYAADAAAHAAADAAARNKALSTAAKCGVIALRAAGAHGVTLLDQINAA